MSKNSNRSGGNNEFPVFAGILLGMVMGLAIAGGIAWFVLKKNPASPPATKDIPQIVKAAETPGKNTSGMPAVAGTASANSDGKARFEFYKELTEKPDTSVKKAERRDIALLKQTHLTPAKSASTPAYFLQEGAYTTMDDAEKVKARLALLGMVSPQATNAFASLLVSAGGVITLTPKVYKGIAVADTCVMTPTVDAGPPVTITKWVYSGACVNSGYIKN